MIHSIKVGNTTEHIGISYQSSPNWSAYLPGESSTAFLPTYSIVDSRNNSDGVTDPFVNLLHTSLVFGNDANGTALNIADIGDSTLSGSSLVRIGSHTGLPIEFAGGGAYNRGSNSHILVATNYDDDVTGINIDSILIRGYRGQSGNEVSLSGLNDEFTFGNVSEIWRIGTLGSGTLDIKSHSDMSLSTSGGGVIQISSGGAKIYLNEGSDNRIDAEYMNAMNFTDIEAGSRFSYFGTITFAPKLELNNQHSSTPQPLINVLSDYGGPSIKFDLPGTYLYDGYWNASYTANYNTTESSLSTMPFINLQSAVQNNSTTMQAVPVVSKLSPSGLVFYAGAGNSTFTPTSTQYNLFYSYLNTERGLGISYDYCFDVESESIARIATSDNLRIVGSLMSTSQPPQINMYSSTLQITCGGSAKVELSASGSVAIGGTVCTISNNRLMSSSDDVLFGRYSSWFYNNYLGNVKSSFFGVMNAYGYLSTGLAGYSSTYFMVGNGSSGTKKNAIRISYNKFYAATAPITSGAGVAEYFEWLDGNPDNEDRIGKFVTLEGEKIRFATPEDDYILGAIDPKPFAIGDIGDRWHGTFLKDVFGRELTEKVFIPKEVDEEGNVLWEDHYEEVEIVNPEFDPSLTFIDRQDRQEYDAITSKGKIVLIDDGTCQVNGYATVGENGIATRSDTNVAVRVMKRVDDTHIYVYIDHVFSPRNC